MDQFDRFFSIDIIVTQISNDDYHFDSQSYGTGTAVIEIQIPVYPVKW